MSLKNCAIQSFASFQNRVVSSWVNSSVKDYTRFNVIFFLRSFSSNNFRLILRIKSKTLMLKMKVDSWENSIFSRKRRTKDCFLLTHNLKSKKVSVRDKFLPDVQFAPPLWNVAPALLSFTAISVAKSSQYYVLHNGHIWISQFLSSYPVILTFAETS